MHVFGNCTSECGQMGENIGLWSCWIIKWPLACISMMTVPLKMVGWRKCWIIECRITGVPLYHSVMSLCMNTSVYSYVLTYVCVCLCIHSTPPLFSPARQNMVNLRSSQSNLVSGVDTRPNSGASSLTNRLSLWLLIV